MKNETEIRGKISNKSDFGTLLNRFTKSAKLIKHRHRLSVLFSDLLKDHVDIQVRLHNSDGQLIVKKGSHTAGSRQESIANFNGSEFLSLIDIVNTMGITSGVVAVAEDWIFEYENVEIKLTQCDDIILCWEIESQNEGQTTSYLKQIAHEFDLKPLSQAELKEYWSWMKKEANKKFSPDTIKDIYINYLSKIN